MRNEIRGFEPTMSAKRTLTCLRSASQQASEANNFSLVLWRSSRP